MSTFGPTPPPYRYTWPSDLGGWHYHYSSWCTPIFVSGHAYTREEALAAVLEARAAARQCVRWLNSPPPLPH